MEKKTSLEIVKLLSLDGIAVVVKLAYSFSTSLETKFFMRLLSCRVWHCFVIFLEGKL